MKYNFDAALSFAGEDREYVEKVLTELKTRQVRVFYDYEYQSELWGSDLTLVLDSYYRKDTKFCIVFCSKHYLDKPWPIIEGRSYRAGQFENRRPDYILPIKIDDTEIPGIHSTVGYLDSRKLTPAQIADIFVEKLEQFDSKAESETEYCYP